MITAASRIDKIAFEKLGAGATLQLAHYEKAEKKYVDENTGKPVSGGFYNSYRLLEELSSAETRWPESSAASIDVMIKLGGSFIYHKDYTY